MFLTIVMTKMRKKKKFDLVLFDIDGTLLDTTDYLFKTFADTLKNHKLPPVPDEELRTHMGKYAKDIYRNITPGFNNELLFQTHVGNLIKNAHLAVPFAKTKEVLETLQRAGIHIAANTNRVSKASKKTLVVGEISHLISLVIGPEDVTRFKPHPEGIEKAMSYFKTSAVKTIMVGDSSNDIEAGKNAGVATIGVTYGFHGQKIADTHPDFLIDEISEILPIILGE